MAAPRVLVTVPSLSPRRRGVVASARLRRSLLPSRGQDALGRLVPTRVAQRQHDEVGAQVGRLGERRDLDDAALAAHQLDRIPFVTDTFLSLDDDSLRETERVALTMAASNYAVGELMDRFGFSPRVVTAAVGAFFLLPGLMWFVTRKRWDVTEARAPARVRTPGGTEVDQSVKLES